MTFYDIGLWSYFKVFFELKELKTLWKVAPCPIMNINVGNVENSKNSVWAFKLLNECFCIKKFFENWTQNSLKKLCPCLHDHPYNFSQ